MGEKEDSHSFSNCIFVVGMTSLTLPPKCRNDAKTSNPLRLDPTDWPGGNGLSPLLGSHRPTALHFQCPTSPQSTHTKENFFMVLSTCTLPCPTPRWPLPHNSFIQFLLSPLCLRGIAVDSKCNKRH